MKKPSLFAGSLLLALCAAGLSCCETAQHRMEREIAATLHSFNAPERYQAYRNEHGEKARKLREAAASASRMRLRITSVRGKTKPAIVPLTEEERRAVREILAQIEETPCLDYPLWLEETYEHGVTGPWPAPPLYWSAMEFVSSSGKVLYTWKGYGSTIGDTALAETYHTERYKPTLMLPTAALARWNKQPFLQRGKRKLDELYTKEAP